MLSEHRDQRDHRQTGNSPSNKSWLIWFAIVIGGAFLYQGHDLRVSLHEEFAPWASDGAKAVGGNVVKGLVLSTMGMLGGLMLIQSSGHRLRWGSLPAVLMLFTIAWCFASISWSVDRGMTARQLVVMGFCVLAAWGATRQLDLVDLAKLGLIVTSSCLAIGLACEIALGTFRPWVSGYRFAGTLHPNGQGVQAAILTISAVCLWLRGGPGRSWFLFLTVIGLLFAFLTKSRTACAALVAALGALTFTRASSGRRVGMAVAAFWLVSLVGFWVVVSNSGIEKKLISLAMMGRQAESAALTGRIPIWTELVRYVAERPGLGYGYQSFWTTTNIETISEQLHWLFREGHSGYIDSVLGIGLVGTLALLGCVLISLGRAASGCQAVATRDRATSAGNCFVVGLLVLTLVVSLMESGLIGPCFASTLAGCCICQISLRPRNRVVAIRPSLVGESA